MTRRFLILVALLSVTMVVTGCDFFRVLAGRPTSKEIEAKRAEILRSAQDDKVVAQDDKDSVPQQNQDSVQVAKPETAASARPAGEKKRYYVIMGAFSSRENAEKYAEYVDTEEFKKLREHKEDYSLEDLRTQCELAFAAQFDGKPIKQNFVEEKNQSPKTFMFGRQDKEANSFLDGLHKIVTNKK